MAGQPFADSSGSSTKEMSPQSTIIAMDSKDLRSAEHPSTCDVTAAATGSMGQA